MRTIPSTLQSHLEQTATTTCIIWKIVCRDGDVFGFADLDTDVEYDDGTGVITYRARAGYEQSQISASGDLGVDNAEATGLVATWDYPEAITETQIQAGKFDYAEHWVWLVNYLDLDTSDEPYVAKHLELMSGTVGKITISSGQLWNTELRSLSQQMKQDIVPLTSLTCRYRFGSPECGIDAEALWLDFEVTDVGLEDDRTFTIDLSPADHAYQPGLVNWVTGDNAGLSPEVEDNTGSVVTLAPAAKYPIQIGDTGRIRPDCRKRFIEDCIGIYDNGLEFGAEPNIPIGDEDALNRGDL